MNLYQHADGGYYCLLSEDAPMKHPDTDVWIKGVVYTGTDGQLRSTSEVRWTSRFKPVDAIPDDPEVEAMVRRCNPDLDFKMEDVWAGWHESESAINSELIELAVCSAVAAMAFSDARAVCYDLERDKIGGPVRGTITLKPQHLRHILTNYDIEREPVEDGYQITMRPKDG